MDAKAHDIDPNAAGELVKEVAEHASELVGHASDAHAATAGHADPVVPVLFGLIIVFITAKVGAILADKIKQPTVLGELLAGVVLGNMVLLNIDCFQSVCSDPIIQTFASIGVIILLFEVGLETKVKDMIAVGVKSALVAIAGVVTPFLMGYYLIGAFIPDIDDMTKLFMGAVMTATSVGITARVFKDLSFLKSEESRIVLGAAVIDDVLGLIILAIVSGIAVTGEIEIGSIVDISVKSFGFVILSLVAGVLLAKRTIKLLSFFRLPGMMIITALTLCFIGSYLANQVGLATIVGAFAVGLVLEELHFKPFEDETTIEEYIRPISYFFVPIFFVITGAMVDLNVFMDPTIVSAALFVTIIAIIGKLVSGWSFFSSNKINRAIIGAGMVPRGEVGLIFATVGKSIGVVDDKLYAITVTMVILTTIISPPILDFLIKKGKNG